MIEVNIIGTGNVAWHLAKAFAAQNNAVVMQVAGRTVETLVAFEPLCHKTVTLDQLTPADVTIIAVNDDSISEVATAIPFENQLVVHTSGFTGMDVLGNVMVGGSALSRKHNTQKSKNRAGVFYPLQSFSKDDVSLDFSEIPIFIETEDEKDEKTLRTLAEIISNAVQSINSEQRRQLHLAAVFANNFTNHCYTLAEELCKTSDIPFEVLHALLKKTTQKAIENGPTKSQTGPAKRDDKRVIKAQQELLKDPMHKEIYTTITQAITDFYGKEL